MAKFGIIKPMFGDEKHIKIQKQYVAECQEKERAKKDEEGLNWKRKCGLLNKYKVRTSVSVKFEETIEADSEERAKEYHLQRIEEELEGIWCRDFNIGFSSADIIKGYK